MDTSFLRRLSGSPHRPLLPQHVDPPSSSTYSLLPLPPHQPPTHPPSQPSSPHQPTMPSPPPAPVPAPLPPSLLPLHRRASYLQHHQQTLLDAQSAGLLAGLARPPSPASSTTTTTSNRTPERGPSVVPVRQPVPKAVGLRGARRGIAATLRELRGVMGEEGGVLDTEVRRREEGIEAVRGFEAKKARLEGEMARACGGEQGTRMEGLRAEKKAVEAGVRGLEERVGELKARARWLGGEIVRGENEMESAVSGWREAARGVDEGAERFLRALPRGEGGKSRSLRMWREEWEGEREGLISRREGVVREQAALDEGVSVWEEVVAVVAGVEALLRDEMRRPEGGGAGAMSGILERMDRAVETLEGRERLAQTRGWTLLVCAVGAELEAFREGRDVLHAALGAAGGDEGAGADGGAYGGEEYRDDDGVEDANGRMAGDEDLGTLSLGAVPVQEHRVRPASLLDRSEDEDDGPGPEFLTSRQEEDE